MTVEITGIDKIIERLTDMENDFGNKMKSFLERLADVGIKVAAEGFQNAQYAGFNDVVVEEPKWMDENTLIISAKGDAVTFIEFGSGVHYTEQHPQANEFGFIRGTFGYKLGKHDSWRYKGDPGNLGEVITEGSHAGEILTHGNPPARAMYDASQEIRDKIKDIAKEVFVND